MKKEERGTFTGLGNPTHRMLTALVPIPNTDFNVFETGSSEHGAE